MERSNLRHANAKNKTYYSLGNSDKSIDISSSDEIADALMNSIICNLSYNFNYELYEMLFFLYTVNGTYSRHSLYQFTHFVVTKRSTPELVELIKYIVYS
jgi:hypothetical protein